jgi:phosphatidylglycerophosphatase B
VLEADPPAVRLHRLIRAHWIASSGYSFPSGHSISAMFFATFFLAMGLSWLSMPRLLLFYLLLPWAVGVCYSRTILQVHTPMDITVGGLEGLLLGVLAFVLVRACLRAM